MPLLIDTLTYRQFVFTDCDVIVASLSTMRVLCVALYQYIILLAISSLGD